MAQPQIILADDEPRVRALHKAVLEVNLFRVHEAQDGVAARDLLLGLDGSADLLITDVKMPRMNGVELARAVAEVFPALPVLFISGWTFDILDAPEWRTFLKSVEDLLAHSK